MERKSFITLGILMNIVELIGPSLLSGWGILIGYITVLLYIVVIGFVYTSNKIIPVSLWFFTSFKKIYHSGFGTLYTEIRNEKKKSLQGNLFIYEQRWFYMRLIGKVDYTQDLTILITRIKSKLDNLYLIIKTKNDKHTNFDNWDGYLDIQSKRDDKLNKLGV